MSNSAVTFMVLKLISFPFRLLFLVWFLPTTATTGFSPVGATRKLLFVSFYLVGCTHVSWWRWWFALTAGVYSTSQPVLVLPIPAQRSYAFFTRNSTRIQLDMAL